jgi:hypothetical protein
MAVKPCPECAKRLPSLPEGNAPLPECACRICRWLRENVKWETEKRGD